MKKNKNQLLLEHLETKIAPFKGVTEVIIPHTGWVKSIRTTLGMSLRQLANRMGVSPQSINEMEKREVSGTITLNTLRELAHSLDMQLVYGLTPKDESIEKMIERRAFEIAKEIVNRTHTTMTLEDQQNSEERINKAIAQKTEELLDEMPKYLWD